MEGTNLFTPHTATVDVALTDIIGNATLIRCTEANRPTGGSGYAIGCDLQASDTGTKWTNTGTATSATWTKLEDAGGTFQIPISASTDATTSTGVSFGLVFSALTSGFGYRGTVSTANFLTAGAVFKADLVAATVGAGFDAITTGVYTGTGLLRLSALGQTTGVVSLESGGGANMLAGGIVHFINMGAATAGTGLNITTTGVYLTGSSGLINLVANAATTTTGILQISTTGLTSGSNTLLTGGGVNMVAAGKVLEIVMGAAIAGNGLSIVSTGIYVTGSTGLANITANSATTTTGLLQVSGTGLTSGSIALFTGGGANMLAGGKVVEIAMGAAIAGAGETITTSGVYAGVGLSVVSAVAATTGILHTSIATQATFTTGRYYSANDSATEVFGIGLNGHIISTVSAAVPTIAVTQQNGITAAAITAGGSDTCGVITTTGTNNNGGTSILQVTFGKTYTVAPKGVMLYPANAAGSKATTTVGTGAFVSAVAATTFDITLPADPAAMATPSFMYVVIA